MTGTFQRQVSQVKSSDTYDDELTVDATLETATTLEANLNGFRSWLRALNDPTLPWTTAPVVTLRSLLNAMAPTTRLTAADSPYTVLSGDCVLFANGIVTLDLPAGVDGKAYKVANTGSGTVTLSPDGAENIYGLGNGVAASLLPGDVIDLHFNATDGWW